MTVARFSESLAGICMSQTIVLPWYALSTWKVERQSRDAFS